MKNEKITTENLKDLFISEYLKRKDEKIKSIHKRKLKVEKEKKDYINLNIFKKVLFKFEKSNILENFFGAVKLSISFSLIIFSIVFFVNLFFVSELDQISYNPIIIFFCFCFSFFFSFSLLFVPKYFFGSIEEHYFNKKINDLDEKVKRIFEVENLIVEQLFKNEEFEKASKELYFRRFDSLKVYNTVINKFEEILKKDFDRHEYYIQFENLKKSSNFVELNNAISKFK